jgi:hypothetical protein
VAWALTARSLISFRPVPIGPAAADYNLSGRALTGSRRTGARSGAFREKAVRLTPETVNGGNCLAKQGSRSVSARYSRGGGTSHHGGDVLDANDIGAKIVRELRESGKSHLPGVGTFTVQATTAAIGFVATPALTRAVIDRQAGYSARADGEDSDEMVARLSAGISSAVNGAISAAHAAGLAVPVRENGVAMELRPDGTSAPIDDLTSWSPDDWKTRS